MQPNDTDSSQSNQEASKKQSGGPFSDNQAAELIRGKIDQLYREEPDATEELQEFIDKDKPRSKHQAFMHELSSSGMSLAEIQTAWHNYYIALSDAEKHEVWQEFYKDHGQAFAAAQPAAVEHTPTQPIQPAAEYPKPPKRTHRQPKRTTQPTIAEMKTKLTAKVNARGKLSAKQHFRSLLFGVGLGSLVMLVLLFGFFNERFIAPFITPSRQVSSTPIIIDPSSTATDNETKVIIPKINVEIPVVYDEPSIEEKPMQNALERGVVHYATTPLPGELGNAVIFGHSSNNILNQGKYKFAFVLLKRLENGDTFYLTRGGTRYAYKVYSKKIVSPNDVDVLGSADKPATATLITCDPPGTSLNRLIVIGEQIAPDPAKNTQSTAPNSGAKPTIIPSNAPSLWHRLWTSLHG